MRPIPDPVMATSTSTSTSSFDPMMMVSMLDDHLVISTPAPLDLEMTEILVMAAASAVAAGSTVMIDLDPGTASEEISARRPMIGLDPDCVTGEGGPVSVLGAGYVALTARDAHWTIDLTHGRLCRSAEAIDPHFVGAEDWTPIRALWVGPTSVTALTTDGTYLSTLAAWTQRTSTGRPART